MFPIVEITVNFSFFREVWIVSIYFFPARPFCHRPIPGLCKITAWKFKKLGGWGGMEDKLVRPDMRIKIKLQI